jgi:hypothetical protein
VTGFFGELGKKVAERWLSLLVLPGFVLIATWTAGVELGHRHALDAHTLMAWAPASGPRLDTKALVLVTAGVLAASMAAGLAVSGGGVAVIRFWTSRGTHPPLAWLTGCRQQCWKDADAKVAEISDKAFDAPGDRALADRLSAAINARNAICLVPPSRPLWIGDRLRALDQRVLRAYDLDLVSVWPRLWLVLPSDARAETNAAHDALAGSARLMTWGVLYLPLAAWWWPALLISGGTFLTAWIRARSATETFASLVESAVDLYASDLATRLGIGSEQRPNERAGLNRTVGLAVTRVARKDTPPRPHANTD